MEFMASTRQIIDSGSINNLRITMHKSAFAKSASLGNIKRPLAKMRRRVEKHICSESGLLEQCWSEITKTMVGMMTEVEEWARDGYDGLVITPKAEELQFEMNNLKATMYLVCYSQEKMSGVDFCESNRVGRQCKII